LRRLLLLGSVITMLLAALPAAAAPPAGALGEHDPATVLVGFSPGADAALAHRLAGAGRVVATLDAIDVAVVAVPEGTVAAAIAAYKGLPGVAYAEPNHIMRPLQTPNDPRYGQQYGLRNIDAAGGWALYDPAGSFSPTGGATIAVVDTGIDLTHPDLFGRVDLDHCRQWLGTGVGLPGCQDTGFHGTHVTGIAAATTDNGEGIAGVAYDANIMALTGCIVVTCPVAATAGAITYAADNGADVANYSFGGSAANQTLQRAVTHAHDQGVLQIAAAGNEGRDDSVLYPAKYPEVMAVSATNRRDTLAGFSSRGPEVDVAAPGDAILSTFPGAQYLQLGGTSMASPHVAGLGALLRSMGLDAAEAWDAIIAGTEHALGQTGEDDDFGHGRINVANSIQWALDMLAEREAAAALLPDAVE
jgi:thermitase